MKKILEDFCNNKDIAKGLLLIDMPTGTGKTYKVAEYIANNYEKIKGKIFFVTQLKKNLPEEEIRRCFKALGKEDDVDNVLLRVEHNVDNLCANFNSVKEELHEYIGENLLLIKIEREVNLINGTKNINEENMFLVQQARDDLQNELERDLRNKVTAYLTYDEKGKERTKAQKKSLLENDEKYKWIAKLYPATQTYKKKIFIMSLDKFLFRYSTIIEPPFNLFESNLLADSIIFMDEFDGTKDVILKKIIKDGLDNQFGIIELFREIYVGLYNPDFTKLLTEESNYNKEENTKRKDRKKLKTPKEVIDDLQKRAKEIYDKYAFVYQFKIHEDSKEGVKFLFQDYKTHTIVDGTKKFLNLEKDKDNSINWIKIADSSNKADLDGSSNEDDVKSIYNLIDKLQGFIRDFQTGVRFIADNYFHLKKERGKEEYNISSESSIRTVLSEFGIEGRYQNYLTINILSNAKRNKFDWKQLSDIIDASVYENGFRYYHIVDNDNHDTISKMDYVAFNDSPEKFLSRLLNRTKVVGISATATIPTTLSNYDLNYLKAKCIKFDNFLDICLSKNYIIREHGVTQVEATEISGKIFIELNRLAKLDQCVINCSGNHYHLIAILLRNHTTAKRSRFLFVKSKPHAMRGDKKEAEALRIKTSNDRMNVATNRRQKSKEDSKMSELSLTHCKYECKYHVVFAPKFRRQVIYGKIKSEVGKILRKLCEYKGIEILEANACPDHIHMLLIIPPKYSIVQVIGYLKGKSSLMIFDKFANLKYKYGNRHFWCKGYYVSTVGRNEKKIAEYIQNQLQEDQANEQLTMKEYIDPFGEEGKK